MPAGKQHVSGGILKSPQLPDCSCEHIIEKDFKNFTVSIGKERWKELQNIINKTTSRYIGLVNSNDVPTITESKKLLEKVKTAAKRCIDPKADNKPENAWHEKLVISLLQKNLGLHSQDKLHRHVRRKAEKNAEKADIFLLIKNLKTTENIRSNVNAYITAKILAEMSLDDVLGGNLRPHPYLANYIIKLAEIWIEITGSQPIPKDVSGSLDEKTFLFAEWVQEIIITANESLPESKCVPEPKNGSILDIVRPSVRK